MYYYLMSRKIANGIKVHLFSNNIHCCAVCQVVLLN